MNPVVKYTLARVGLFVAVSAVLLVLPIPIHVLLKLMIAVLLSAGLAFVLLRGAREDVAAHLARVAEQRAVRRERLRAALAGEDGGAGDEAGDARGEGR